MPSRKPESSERPTVITRFTYTGAVVPRRSVQDASISQVRPSTCSRKALNALVRRRRATFGSGLEKNQDRTEIVFSFQPRYAFASSQSPSVTGLSQSVLQKELVGPGGRLLSKPRPVCLIIRDGWGHNPNHEANACWSASTPNIDALMRDNPWTLIDTCGEAVGLPPGYQGSSEAGHLNIGAGRIVEQELKRINDAMESGELWKMESWKTIVKEWKANPDSSFHLMCLLQDEGVHGHQEHMFKFMRLLRKERPEGRIVLHPFLDGRDTPPRSTKEYIVKLLKVMEEVGGCVIGTAMGRFFSMDRSKDWRLTSQAYNCIVSAEGRSAPDIMTAVDEWYAEDENNSDEYVPPYVIGDYDGVHDGDCVVHCNYRQDRAYQLTLAFVDDEYKGPRTKVVNVHYLGLTRYYDEFKTYLIGAMDEGGGMENLLGEVLSNAGYRQLRIAETQKFRHVTSFFNGKSTTPYPGEDQVEIKGRFEADTFAEHPEMEAYIVTDALLKRLEAANRYDFVAVNFANADMVGHTGKFDAAVKACEVVDDCVGRLVNRMLELDGHILITADHGNSDQMIDYETGMVKTSHSLHPVELIYVARDSSRKRMVKRGKLGDIAPTILYLFGLPIPKEMTGDVLLEDIPEGERESSSSRSPALVA
mmetsp:Transcript_46521/g.77485  ORF Transcript_46521/g.77485 Transcript_46521/m.77485 type:complete len:645 (+) Transcript_46521:98-2032(+)